MGGEEREWRRTVGPKGRPFALPSRLSSPLDNVARIEVRRIRRPRFSRPLPFLSPPCLRVLQRSGWLIPLLMGGKFSDAVRVRHVENISKLDCLSGNIMASGMLVNSKEDQRWTPSATLASESVILTAKPEPAIAVLVHTKAGIAPNAIVGQQTTTFRGSTCRPPPQA